MSLTSGSRLGSYEVLAPLGAGGMGEVYRARDTKLGREVAIKVLRDELASDPERLRRFEQEARAASALDHPNIITIHDIAESDGVHYIVMQYVEGKTLRELLSEGPLPVKELLEYARQIAEGLTKAHAVGIIHRDLKPDNLMVTTDGYVKILDFGLAKLLPRPEVDSEAATMTKEGTVAGAVMGTACYMSPEQALGKPLDARTDVFSFGAVLYEMATGAKAFQGETPAALFDEILHKTLSLPSPLNSEMPNTLDRVIQKALDKNPTLRYPSAKELLVELRTVQAGPALLKSKPEKSIVVLPFENMSPDPEQEYFSDGLTEEVIADLSRVRALLVISRSSAMTFKGTDKRIPDVARELGVRYVLEGSVRKAGNHLRITAQLIDAQKDTHLWAEKYTGTLDNVFDIQENVSRSIVEALKLRLGPEQDRRIAQRPVTSVQAYECYLRAKYELMRFRQDGIDAAVALLEKALEIEGPNELLFAALGYAHTRYFTLGIKPDERHLERAEGWAARAFEMNPDSPVGHVVRAFALWKKRRTQEAVTHLKTALDADPSNSEAMIWLAYISGISGQMTTARFLYQKAVAVDPLAEGVSPGWVEFYSANFDAACDYYRTDYQMDPESPYGRWAYGSALAWARRTDEACEVLEELVRDTPETVYGRFGSFLLSALRGETDEALQAVSPELIASAKVDEQLPWMMAACYAMTGRVEEALDWLEHAVRSGFINYPFLAQMVPFFGNIRGEERFTRLMERVKYEWEHFKV